MTTTVLILVVTFFASVWLAVDLLRPGFRSFFRASAPASDDKGSGGATSYGPVGRLLAEGDFSYLADEEDLAARLLETRSAAMRLYLKRLRRDYVEVWRICKLLAPISPDPAFASTLSKQYWSFHCAYFAVLVQCLLPSMGRRSTAADALVQTLSEIRDQAQGLLAASESAMAPSASAA